MNGVGLAPRGAVGGVGHVHGDVDDVEVRDGHLVGENAHGGKLLAIAIPRAGAVPHSVILRVPAIVHDAKGVGAGLIARAPVVVGGAVHNEGVGGAPIKVISPPVIVLAQVVVAGAVANEHAVRVIRPDAHWPAPGGLVELPIVVRLHALNEAAHQARQHHAIAAGVGPLRVARVVVHHRVLHGDVANHASVVGLIVAVGEDARVGEARHVHVVDVKVGHIARGVVVDEDAIGGLAILLIQVPIPNDNEVVNLNVPPSSHQPGVDVDAVLLGWLDGGRVGRVRGGEAQGAARGAVGDVQLNPQIVREGAIEVHSVPGLKTGGPAIASQLLHGLPGVQHATAAVAVIAAVGVNVKAALRSCARAG